MNTKRSVFYPLLMTALFASSYALAINNPYDDNFESKFEQLLPKIQQYIGSFGNRINGNNSFTQSQQSWRYFDQKQNAYIIQINLGGLSKNEVEISINDNRLSIHGQSAKQTKNSGKYGNNSSYYSSQFSQSFNLPKDIRHDKISAKFEDSILKITLPKDDNAKSSVRKINIQ